jgi:hypothetical protein
LPDYHDSESSACKEDKTHNKVSKHVKNSKSKEWDYKIEYKGDRPVIAHTHAEIYCYFEVKKKII